MAASLSLGVEDAVDKQIIAIEGLADGDRLHPVQAAFVELDAMQCGYCTSGMVISAVALLERQPRLSDAQIREALTASPLPLWRLPARGGSGQARDRAGRARQRRARNRV